MVELLPAAGMAAYVLVLPIAGVILLILALVTGSYRQVVMTYTQRGGSYVVARANFGPRIAQISSAALLIDYVVTVAVQCASGTFAVVSAVPSLGPYHLEITVGALLLISYANLRGMKEAGRIFAVPVYSFIIMLTVLIVTGVFAKSSGACHNTIHSILWGRCQSIRQRADHGRNGTGVVAGVRQRRHFADRGRGDRRRGKRLPKAAGSQCPSRVDPDGVCSGVSSWWASSTWCTPPTPRRLSPNIPRCSPKSVARSSATA